VILSKYNRRKVVYTLDSFDKTAKKAKDLFDIACKKTEETLNVQKLKFRLASAERDLTKFYAALGEIRYKELKIEETVSDEASAVINSIEFELKEIEELKKEISKLTGTVVCKNCGTALPNKAEFCFKCGEKTL
jgi:ribosomal protein L40E